MIARLCLALALVAVPTFVEAQNAQGQIVTPVDTRGLPFGTVNNPFYVSGGTGGGGGGGGGSVTGPGINGTSAQAIQGINGGVPVPVTGSFASAPIAGSQEQDVRASQTLNAATANATLSFALNGQSTLGLTFTGLAASGATVTFEQSNDGGTTWTGVNEVNAGTGVPSATRNTDGQTRIAGQGRTNLRIRVSTTGTGTITVASNTSVREGLVTLASPLPPGTNVVGSIANTAFGISGTLPAYAATPTFNLGTLNGAATAANQNATAAGTSATSAQAVQGVTGGVPQNVQGTVTVGNPYTTTTSNALQPPTAAAGKITRTSTALTANTSTTIAAANANRIAFGLQCGSGAVAVDETGGTLTAAAVGNGTLFVPSGTAPYFTPPIATLSAITAYTATAQTCVVTEYLR